MDAAGQSEVGGVGVAEGDVSFEIRGGIWIRGEEWEGWGMWVGLLMTACRKYFEVEKLTSPPFFPIMSLLPMRCMLYAKENYPYAQYEDAFGELWHFLWREHKDISKPEALAECLGRHFEKGDVEKSELFCSFSFGC